MSAPTTTQKLAAEVIGTFVLVFFGVGSVVVFGAAGGSVFPATTAGIALAFGLAVLVMAYAVGRISGGHFNPAVSVGAAVGGRMAWSEVPLYIGAQLAGAIVGAGALFVVAKGYDGWSADGHMGTNQFGDKGSGISWWSAGLLEIILTLLFIFVILAVTDARFEHPNMAPLAIGLTLSAIHLVAIPATGTSVNPARSIGPAIFGGGDALSQVWLFIVAPFVGGILGGVLYPAIFGHAGEPVPGSGMRFGRPAPVGAVPGYGAPDAYQQQWNQQEVWPQQPQQQWQDPNQQWAQQQPGQQQWQDPNQQWAQQPGQQQWQDPNQQWAQQQPQQQWSDPGQQQWQQPAPGQHQWQPEPEQPQQPPPQQWPEGEDGGRTQIRPPQE